MIHYKPRELPGLWKKIEGTDEPKMLAAADGITVQMYDSGGLPTLLISYDGEPIDEITAMPEELVDSARSTYNLYIREDFDDEPLAVVTADPPEESDDDDDEHVLSDLEKQHEEEINESESNLRDAVTVFLHSVLDEDPIILMMEREDVIEDFLEHALKYLHLKHKLAIYRPMVLEMDDGTEVFKDFPYPFLDLSDEEANPVFMPE